MRVAECSVKKGDLKEGGQKRKIWKFNKQKKHK